MLNVARFIIANRRAAIPTRSDSENATAERATESFTRARSLLAANFDIQRAAKPRPSTGRWQIHLEGSVADLQAKLKELPPDTIGEPVVPRRPAVLSPKLMALGATADGNEVSATGTGAALNVAARSNGAPVAEADATLLFIDASGQQNAAHGKTGANGQVSFAYDPKLWVPSLLMVEPDSGTWNWWQNFPQGSVSIDLQPLPKGGPLGWWHYLAGVQQDGARRGAGIRIGVVDTGLGSHPYLSHVKSLGAVIDGAHDTSAKAGLDVLGHGTHVSGIIAARPPQASNDYAGVASGADVFVVRVFPPQGEPNQGDIADPY